MNRTDRYILSCSTWDDFYRRTGSLSEADKGRIFERLVQLYLQTAPEYRTILQDVWLLRDVPPKLRKKLKLPLSDEGIDLIARTRRGLPEACLSAPFLLVVTVVTVVPVALYSAVLVATVGWTIGFRTISHSRMSRRRVWLGMSHPSLTRISAELIAFFWFRMAFGAERQISREVMVGLVQCCWRKSSNFCA